MSDSDEMDLIPDFSENDKDYDETTFRRLRELQKELAYPSDDDSPTLMDPEYEFESSLEEMKERYAFYSTFRKLACYGTEKPPFDLVIPETQNDEPVAMVSFEEVDHYYDVLSITIPKTVKFIDVRESNLSDCFSLKRFIVDPENPYFTTLDDGRILLEKSGHCILAATGDATIPDGYLILERTLREQRERENEKSFLEEVAKEEADPDVLFTAVRIDSTFADAKDCDTNSLVIELKEGHLRAYTELENDWIAGQSINEREYVFAHDDEKHRKLLQLIGKEIAALSILEESPDHDAYEIDYSATAFTEDGKYRAYWASAKLFALFRQFFHMDSRWDDFPMHETPDYPGIWEIDPYNYSRETKRTVLFSLRFESEDEVITFSDVEYQQEGQPRYGQLEYEVITPEKEGVYRDSVMEDVEDEDLAFNSESRLFDYCEALVDEGEGPFVLEVKGKTYRLKKIERRLYDLVGYLSPKGFKVPKSLLIENGQTEYVAFRAGESVPAEAYRDSQTLRNVAIYPDVERIGKDAFRNSSLKHILLRPEFYAYRGTGKFKPYIEEGAFEGLNELSCFVYNGMLCVGELPFKYGDTMAILPSVSPEKLKKMRGLQGIYLASKDFVFQLKSLLRYSPSAYLVHYTSHNYKEGIVVPTQIDNYKVEGIETGAFNQVRSAPFIKMRDTRLLTGANIFNCCDGIGSIVFDRDLDVKVESLKCPLSFNGDLPEGMEKADPSDDSGGELPPF